MMKTLAFWGETKGIRFYQWGFVFCKESSKYQASLSHGHKQASKILGKGMWARALPPLSFGRSCFIHLSSSTLFSLRCSFFCIALYGLHSAAQQQHIINLLKESWV
jgi:hypothetical protein